MLHKKKLLFTSCGGDLGYSVGKIIKQYKHLYDTVGCDATEDHIGQFVYDVIHKVPYTKEDGYCDALKKIVENEKIDLIIPLSDYDIAFFAKNNIDSINNVPILKINNNLLNICLSKYNTAMFLKQNNLPYPWTVIVDDTPPSSLPCILKPIKGCGSRNVSIIEQYLSQDEIKKYENNYIYQQLIVSKDEYTCCIYKNDDFIETIILKRELKNGMTNMALVVQNETINTLLYELAKKLNFNGSINIQLKISNEQTPLIFEINPRFSSTVHFRHAVGFCDLIWCINDYFNIKNQINYIPKLGAKMYKTYDEVIINT